MSLKFKGCVGIGKACLAYNVILYDETILKPEEERKQTSAALKY